MWKPEHVILDSALQAAREAEASAEAGWVKIKPAPLAVLMKFASRYRRECCKTELEKQSALLADAYIGIF